jgi:hypothetical protein
MGRVVGLGCAALCVVLLGYAIWVSTRGDFGAGLVSVALAFALLLVSVGTLRVQSRI